MTTTTSPTSSAATSAPVRRRISRLLVANRGEIARRIMRTARARGITSVAVFSEPDAEAPFVREADIAVALRGTTSAESYLDSEQIIAAAVASGADAVHPGYGFLSENAQFARDVTEAGLIWVGPSPESIVAMSGKVAAKRLVAAAGVPLLPGAELGDGEVEGHALLGIGESVGYPLLVKASAGGGGKGMRVVERAEDLIDAVAGARREAAASFGDATVFLERYVTEGRHIEVQVFGDTHGTVVHLLERECSIQRRHQKVVEEAPAAFLSETTRTGLHAAAVAAAQAINYVGAGTVEFLVDGDDYFFLEMNTRLQVEHPVTEEVLGLDLVDWQLEVAEGAPLPTADVVARGHAIEVRLYAEDPANGDLPSTGTVTEFEFTDPRLRVESGVTAGSVVSPHYDPMLAKVIAHGRDRDAAAAILASGLRAGRIHGVSTNRDMLVEVLESADFLNRASTTAFLEQHPQVRTPTPAYWTAAGHAVAAVAALRQAEGDRVPVVADRVASPGWRNVASTGGETWLLAGAWAQVLLGADAVTVHRRTDFSGVVRWGLSTPQADDSQTEPSVEVTWLDGLSAAISHVENSDEASRGAVQVTVLHPDRISVRSIVVVEPDPDAESATVFVDDPRDHSAWTLPPRFPAADDAAAGAGPATPVPGTITHVAVTAGDVVAAGDVLVVLEAMKMEHRITADTDAEVAEVLVGVGDSVEAHQVVVVLAAHPNDAIDVEEGDAG